MRTLKTLNLLNISPLRKGRDRRIFRYKKGEFVPLIFIILDLQVPSHSFTSRTHTLPQLLCNYSFAFLPSRPYSIQLLPLLSPLPQATRLTCSASLPSQMWPNPNSKPQALSRLTLHSSTRLVRRSVHLLPNFTNRRQASSQHHRCHIVGHHVPPRQRNLRERRIP